MLSRHLENATAHPEVVARARWMRLVTTAPSNEADAAAAAAAAAGRARRRWRHQAATGQRRVVEPLLEVCVPSTVWHTCMSCAGSYLEQRCVKRGNVTYAVRVRAQ